MKKRTLTKTTKRKIKNHLQGWFFNASFEEYQEGLNWYKNAQEFTEEVASKYHLNPFTVACVLSILSPNNKWERNKIDCIAVIEDWLNGGNGNKVNVCTYGQNKTKAFEILNDNAKLESVSIKTWNFAHNVGNLSAKHCTVDKWIIRACLVYPEEGKRGCVETLTAKQYGIVSEVINEIATEFHLKAYEVQAIIWCSIRGKW